jgi:hypothetical protein
MAKPEDPEQLLAEALRAQATRAPMPQPTGSTMTPPEPGPTVSSGLSLLSGNDLGITYHAAPPSEPGPLEYRPAPSRLHAGWILLLAIVFGLAAGVGAGLLTVV